MNIKLTEEQRNNLLTLLSRVEIKGSEAIAFVELIQILNGLDTESDINELQ